MDNIPREEMQKAVRKYHKQRQAAITAMRKAKGLRKASDVLCNSPNVPRSANDNDISDNWLIDIPQVDDSTQNIRTSFIQYLCELAGLLIIGFCLLLLLGKIASVLI
jgi:hypothetical protein